MNGETWTTLGTIAVFLVVGGFNAWRTMRAERRADEARRHALKSARQTEGTGNGFAGEVLARLDRIEARGEQTHDLMVKHLSDHARSDLS